MFDAKESMSDREERELLKARTEYFEKELNAERNGREQAEKDVQVARGQRDGYLLIIRELEADLAAERKRREEAAKMVALQAEDIKIAGSPGECCACVESLESRLEIERKRREEAEFLNKAKDILVKEYQARLEQSESGAAAMRDACKSAICRALASPVGKAYAEEMEAASRVCEDLKDHVRKDDACQVCKENIEQWEAAKARREKRNG